MEKLTKHAVLAGLHKLVEEVGEGFVYEQPNPDKGNSCYYVWNNAPSCAVGRVLHKMGVPLHQLRTVDPFTSDDGCEEPSENASGALRKLNIPHEPVVSVILRAFQIKQDTGYTYVEALKYAETEAEKGESSVYA